MFQVSLVTLSFDNYTRYSGGLTWACQIGEGCHSTLRSLEWPAICSRILKVYHFRNHHFHSMRNILYND